MFRPPVPSRTLPTGTGPPVGVVVLPPQAASPMVPRANPVPHKNLRRERSPWIRRVSVTSSSFLAIRYLLLCWSWAHDLFLMPGSELVAPDLSGRRQRHLLNELHLTRILVSSQARLDERLDFGREFAAALDALLGRYVRLDHLPPDLIRYADDGCHRYCRVLDERAFDLRWTDPIARGVDDIVLPSGEVQVPLVIDPGQVSGQEPLAQVFLLRRLRVLPIPKEHHRVGALDRDLAERVRTCGFAMFVDDGHPVAGISLAHASGFDRVQGRGIADHVVALGLPVNLVDRDAEALSDPVEHLLAKRLPAAHGGAQPEVPRWPGIALTHHLQRRRGKKRIAHRMLRHQAERAFRIEGTRRLHAEGAAAVMQSRKEGVHETADPRPVGRGPEEIVTLREKVMRQLKSRQMPEEDAVSMQRTLRAAGRTARIDQ